MASNWKKKDFLSHTTENIGQLTKKYNSLGNNTARLLFHMSIPRDLAAGIKTSYTGVKNPEE